MTLTMKGRIEQSCEEREQMLNQAKDILNRAKETGRFSAEDEDKVNQLHAEIEDIDRFLERHRGDGADPAGFFNSLQDPFNPRRHQSGPTFMDAAGNRIQAYASGEPIASSRSDGEIGDIIHKLLKGEPLASQAGSTDSAGGYMINGDLSSMVIDLARNASVCMRAGAMTLPMNSSELRIARIASDPTSYWRPETAAVTSSTMTFEAVTLRAKTLACIVPVSIEMLEDASNAASLIESAITASMGQQLDSAGLVGTGAASDPLGIRNHASVNTIASVGTPSDYSKFSLAVGDIMAANYPGEVSGLSWITNARTDDTLDVLEDSTGQPLQMTPRVSQLRRYSTETLPSDEGGGSDEAVSIVGHFPQLVFGMRTNSAIVRILDSGTVTDASSDTWNANTQLLKHIVVYLRADVALLRPSWFTVLTGITA